MVNTIGYSPKIENKIKNGEIKKYAVSRLFLVSFKKGRLFLTGSPKPAATGSAIDACTSKQVIKNKYIQ